MWEAEARAPDFSDSSGASGASGTGGAGGAGGTLGYALRRGEAEPSFGEVARLWREDVDFRAFFARTLAAAPFEAFLLETPPVTAALLDRRFELVLVDAPGLAHVEADPAPFARRFAEADPGADVVVFDNLGGDARLVAPCPRGHASAYAHLAAFSRAAPPDQQHALWRAVGEAFAERVGDAPVWLSTSGLGVYWLHVRLDARPKYYTHAPYRRPP